MMTADEIQMMEQVRFYLRRELPEWGGEWILKGPEPNGILFPDALRATLCIKWEQRGNWFGVCAEIPIHKFDAPGVYMVGGRLLEQAEQFHARLATTWGWWSYLLAVHVRKVVAWAWRGRRNSR